MKILFQALLIVFILVFILLAILSPLVTVWVLNTLFGLNIAYTFWSWLAAAILHSWLATRVYYGKR